MSYASLIDVHRLLPQIEDTAENNVLLQSCLSRATGIVRDTMRVLLADPSFDYVAWPVAATAKTITSYGGPYLQLPPHRAGSVTVVNYGTSLVPSTTYIETAQGSLQVVSSAGLTYPMAWYSSGFATWGSALYTVTAVWGYGPTAPESVVQVVLELSVNFWRGKDRGMWSDTIGQDGQGSVQYTGGMTNLQKQSLQNVCAQLYQVAV